jgi:hypothetical protein
MSVHIPVSIGELFDKYSILEIKHMKIKNPIKLTQVKKELDFLKPYIQKYNLDIKIYHELKNINLKLWEIEDQLRNKEKLQIFDNTFIQLARNVYFTNDKRAQIKNNINVILKSEIIEVKDYVDYKV